MSSSVAWESTDDVLSRVAEDVKVSYCGKAACCVLWAEGVHWKETQEWIPNSLVFYKLLVDEMCIRLA